VHDMSDAAYPVLARSLRTRRENIGATIASLEAVIQGAPKAACVGVGAAAAPRTAGLHHAGPGVHIDGQRGTFEVRRPPTEATSMEALTELLDDLPQVVRVIRDDPQGFLREREPGPRCLLALTWFVGLVHGPNRSVRTKVGVELDQHIPPKTEH
jgi:hypothetical protein